MFQNLHKPAHCRLWVLFGLCLWLVNAPVQAAMVAAPPASGVQGSANMGQAASSPIPLGGITGLEAPVDPEKYQLVVGDTFQLALTRPGSQTNFKTLKVLPEGKLVLPFLGELKASGQRLSDFTAGVVKRYKQAFPDLRVSFLLMDPGSFVVNLLGGVNGPGLYQVNGLTRLSYLLRQGGGLAPWGSKRRVLLLQNGQERAVDLVKYEEEGDLSQNPYLTPGLMVRVPVRHAVVDIKGEVNAPNSYELLASETLRELVSLAKGFTVKANGNRIMIQRVLKSDKDPSAFRQIDVRWPVEGAPAPQLEDGDVVTVYSYTHAKGSFVSVEGPVRLPGQVDLNAGSSLKDVLFRVGGLDPAKKPTEAMLLTIDEKDNPRKERLSLKGYPDIEDRTLQPGDRLVVLDPATIRGFVTLEGALVHPGPIPFQEGLTVYDAVNLAGGLRLELFDSESIKKEEADIKTVTFGTIDLRNSFVLRRRLDKDGQLEEDKIIPLRLDKLILDKDFDYNMELQRGDRVIVAEENDEVMVSGFVEDPGTYAFLPNRSAIHYLRRAGLSRSADYNTIQVRRQNGVVVKGRDVVVYPGEQVVVEEKAGSRRTNRLSFYTNLLTSVLVFSNLFNK